MYKNRSSRKTDSHSEKRSSGSPILLKIVSENQFSGKTNFYTIASSFKRLEMGGILSMGSLACCAGTAACNAVCSVFGSCHNSTMSKLMYVHSRARLANDRRPGRLLDLEIIIDFKILVGVVLRSVSIVPIIGWNQLELGNRVQKSGRDHDR